MGVKYFCDITGDEYNPEDIGSKIIKTNVLVKTGLRLNSIGEIYISVEELPEKLKKNVNSSDKKSHLDIICGGNMIPIIDNKKIKLEYNVNDFEILSISLRVGKFKTKKGIVEDTYNYDSENEFKKKIKKQVKDICNNVEELSDINTEPEKSVSKTYR